MATSTNKKKEQALEENKLFEEIIDIDEEKIKYKNRINLVEKKKEEDKDIDEDGNFILPYYFEPEYLQDHKQTPDSSLYCITFGYVIGIISILGGGASPIFFFLVDLPFLILGIKGLRLSINHPEKYGGKKRVIPPLFLMFLATSFTFFLSVKQIIN